MPELVGCPYCRAALASRWGTGQWSVHCDDCCRRVLAMQPSTHPRFQAFSWVIAKHRGPRVALELQSSGVPF